MTSAPQPERAPQPEGPSVSFVALGLYCWRLRSQYIFAKALAERFPDEASWQAVWDDPLWTEIIAAVGDAAQVIRLTSQGLDQEDPRVRAVIEETYAETLENVHPLADLLGIAPEDVLSALLEGFGTPS